MDRIAALEDALQISTNGVHPLLSQEFLEIKKQTSPEIVDVGSPLNGTDSYDEEIDDAFGTLSIGEGQGLRFLGSSAVEVSCLSGLYLHDRVLTRL